jgi:hypothetical protein
MSGLPERGFPGRAKNRGLRTMFAAFSLDLQTTGAATDVSNASSRASTPARYEGS